MHTWMNICMYVDIFYVGRHGRMSNDSMYICLFACMHTCL